MTRGTTAASPAMRRIDWGRLPRRSCPLLDVAADEAGDGPGLTLTAAALLAALLLLRPLEELVDAAGALVPLTTT